MGVTAVDISNRGAQIIYKFDKTEQCFQEQKWLFLVCTCEMLKRFLGYLLYYIKNTNNYNMYVLVYYFIIYQNHCYT